MVFAMAIFRHCYREYRRKRETVRSYGRFFFSWLRGRERIVEDRIRMNYIPVDRFKFDLEQFVRVCSKTKSVLQTVLFRFERMSILYFLFFKYEMIISDTS